MARALAVAVPGATLSFDTPDGGAHAVMLSRLPEVHSVLASASTAAFPLRARAAPVSPTAGRPGVLELGSSPEPASANAGGSGGTLASPAVPAARPDNPPNVLLVAPAPSAFQGTMPSPERASGLGRASNRRGIAVPWVVLLVILALSAGFLCGWAVGRAT
jgi:hypothetical protein